jgi:hypothetical protein
MYLNTAQGMAASITLTVGGSLAGQLGISKGLGKLGAKIGKAMASADERWGKRWGFFSRYHGWWGGVWLLFVEKKKSANFEKKNPDITDDEEEFSKLTPLKNWNVEVMSALPCVGDMVDGLSKNPMFLEHGDTAKMLRLRHDAPWESREDVIDNVKFHLFLFSLEALENQFRIFQWTRAWVLLHPSGVMPHPSVIQATVKRPYNTEHPRVS